MKHNSKPSLWYLYFGQFL